MKACHRALFRPPHRQGSPAPGLRGRGVDWPEISRQPLRGQGGLNDTNLPIGHKIICRMLQLTAATGFVVSARRLNPRLRRGFDPDICQLVAVTDTADGLSRQGPRGKEGPIGDPVALVPETLNCGCKSGFMCHGR